MKQFKLKKIKFLNVNRKKKTTEVLNLFGERVTSSIGRTVIACFAVIGFFYVTPIFINFAGRIRYCVSLDDSFALSWQPPINDAKMIIEVIIVILVSFIVPPMGI